MRRLCLEETSGGFCSTSENLTEEDSNILQPYASLAGTRIEDWMKGLEAIVVLESALLHVFLLAKSLSVKKCVLILNMDWSDPSQV